MAKAKKEAKKAKKTAPVSPLATKAEIESHIAKRRITDQVKEVLKKNKVHTLGLTLQSLKLVKAEDDTGSFHCTKSVDRVVHSNGNTCVVPICIEWSDGQDHSADNPPLTC
jgi:hypothetical protein